MKIFRLLTLCVAGLLTACADPDRVVFVTTTNLGMGADAKASKTYIGYDRQEIFIGPAYTKHGQLPPVAASMQSDRKIFNPATRQTYATGNAALIVSKRLPAFDVNNCKVEPADLNASEKDAWRCMCNKGCVASGRRLAFVGTNTHFGINVTVDQGIPASVHFGYGRQEASVLPLSKGEGGTDIYPSALAYLNTETEVAPNGGGAGTGLWSAQFIATGGAAEGLAGHPAIIGAFESLAHSGATANAIAAENAVTSGLTPEQVAAAKQAAQTQFAEASGEASKIITSLGLDPANESQETSETSRKLLSTKLKSVGVSDDAAKFFVEAKTVGELRRQLFADAPARKALSKN